MAPAAVRFHPAAAQEAESAYDWYAARNPSAAHGFREELRHAVDAVADNPLTWPRHGSRARRAYKEIASRLDLRGTLIRVISARDMSCREKREYESK